MVMAEIIPFPKQQTSDATPIDSSYSRSETPEARWVEHDDISAQPLEKMPIEDLYPTGLS